jgi:hypothetical protein
MKCDFIHFFIFNGVTPSKMVAHPCATQTLNKSEFPYLPQPELRGRAPLAQGWLAGIFHLVTMVKVRLKLNLQRTSNEPAKTEVGQHKRQRCWQA